MSDLFEDKTEIPDFAFFKKAAESSAPEGAVPVGTYQTLQRFRADRADDAMSVRNLSRPRRGHAY